MARKATAHDYKTIRETVRRTGRPARFAPDVAAARATEQNSRTGTAQSRAITVLRRLYPEEWRSLYEQALAEVDAERGPLPGDES